MGFMYKSICTALYGFVDRVSSGKSVSREEIKILPDISRILIELDASSPNIKDGKEGELKA